MKRSMIALGLGLAAGALAAVSPVHAQAYAKPAAPPAEVAKVKPSGAAVKAIIALQTAVNANDAANIPARLAEAQAVAKTADDRYLIGALQLKASIASNDMAMRAAGLEAMLASGKVPKDKTPAFTVELAKAYKNGKQLDRAAAVLERAVASDPANVDAVAFLAETRQAQGRTPEAVALLQKAIAAKKAAGQKPDESWYKVALAMAYQAKLPAAIGLSRDWVAAYPSVTAWRDSISIYRNLVQPDDATLFDVLRLQRAVGALVSEGDFHKYTYLAVSRGFAGEGRSALEEGFAAKKIDRSKPMFAGLMQEATAKSAGDKAALATTAAAGLKAPTARQALAAGDFYYGQGDYAKAIELYRAALTKSGADASLINLHLGMALARSGDKAGATAALNAVTGPRAEIAKYWLLYLATRG